MWLVTVQLAPWLLLGAVVAGLMHALLPPSFLRRNLAGPSGVAKAVALGVPLPLCSCGVIPVGLGLKKQGAGDGAAVGFMISTPQTGVDSVLVTASMLGWPLALFKLVVAVATGLVGGWIADRATPRSSFFALPVLDPAASGPAAKPTLRGALTAALAFADELLHSVWRWLAVGIAVSAAMAVWLPSGALGDVADYGPLAAMGVALVVSLPLYVCATASVPVAAALVAGGLPMGAAVVFLMAGPATNAATIGAVHRALGWRALAVYLTTIIVGGVAGGLLFEWLSPSASTTVGLTHAHSTTAWWAIASGVLLIGWMARFAWRDAGALFAGGEAPHHAA